MNAICLPQPYAGLVLSGQIQHINAPRSTSLRGELLVFSSQKPHTPPPIRHRDIPGLTEIRGAYLGFVQVRSSNDAFEADALAYLGNRWHWHVEVGDMLSEPLEAPVRRNWAETFKVSASDVDAIDACRIGWSKWWDQALLEMARISREGPGPTSMTDIDERYIKMFTTRLE